MSNARFSILQARAISDKRISDAQFRTLAALGMYADRDGWCFPSLTRIGGDCNKSKQAAGRDIIHLKKTGYVDVYPQFDKATGSRRPNKYRLKFDPPVNVDDSTPSTSEVDTPSTSEVDVNVPYNDPKKVISSADKKVDGILFFERLAKEAEALGKVWNGRELLAEKHVPYGDWFHSKTGLQMYPAKGKPKVDATWLKEFQVWEEYEIDLQALNSAYQVENDWRKTKSGIEQNITHPRELTAKAKVIAATPQAQKTSRPKSEIEDWKKEIPLE